jgi:hypothetical protein
MLCQLYQMMGRPRKGSVPNSGRMVVSHTGFYLALVAMHGYCIPETDPGNTLAKQILPHPPTLMRGRK